MKNSSNLIAMCAFVVSALLFTQSGLCQWEPPGDDVLGMYYGPNHENYYELPFGQSDPISVILTTVTGASIGGFEFILTYDSSVLIMTNEGLWPGDLNFGSPNSGEYYVGLSWPRFISTGNATLCEPSFFCFTSDPVYIYVTHWGEFATIPENISYFEFEIMESFHAMYPASGDFDDPIFRFNPVLFASENRTWSELKSLYR